MFTLGIGVSNAQNQYYRAFQYASHFKFNGVWGSWSDWIDCSVPIALDLTNDVIYIYSNKTQRYNVISYDGKYTDSSGGQNVRFSVIDQDYDRGQVRLRIETNGNSQIYGEFADCAWVYNARRTQ